MSISFGMASKFEEGKTIDGNVRPVNLLSKLYQKCVQLEIKKKEDEPKSNSLNNISEVEQRDPDTISDIKELSSTIKNICSPVESVNMNNKLKLLSSLSTALKANPLLYEAIESSPLLYFSEKLLKNYSKTICRYWDQMHTTHCDTSELTLLIPILEILSLSVDTSVQEIRSVLLYNSEVILYLMQTVTQCCYNVSITHMKLNDALFEKKLAGALYDMHCLEVQALYTNWLGFHVPINRLKGYYMTLFEVSDVREMNINQYIIKKQPPSGSEYTEIETENPKIDLVKDCYEDVATAEWSPITVARMILLKTALVYTREDWKDCLFRFSSQLKDVLQQVNEDGVHQCLVGSMCGFRSIDGLFEGESLTKVPYQRGQILALTGDWAMVWAVDVGVLGFVPKVKMCVLPQDMENEPWLISVCLLRGPISKMDEDFFKAACKFLCVVLEINTQIGKHMLLNETGKHILSIIEYPDVSIRLSILRLILCLAKNSKDVISFFEEKEFDLLLIGKLEKFGHAYTSKLYINKYSMEQEIEKLFMILVLILKQKEDIRNWPENRRVSRVIWMYRCDKNCKLKDLLEKCLLILSGKSKENQRGNSGQRRGRGQGRHYHNSVTRISDNNEPCNDLRGTGDSDQMYRERRANYRGSSNFRDNIQDNTAYRGIRQYGQPGVRNYSEGQHVSIYGKIRRGSYITNHFEEDGYINYYDRQPNSHNKRLDLQTEMEHHARDVIESHEYETGNKKFPEAVSSDKTESEDIKDSDVISNHKSFSNDVQAQGENFEDVHRMIVGRTSRYYKSETQKINSYPHKPSLPLLNRLRKPDHMLGRLSASYASLLELCDDMPSAPAIADTESVKITYKVNLHSDVDYVMYGSKADVKCDKTHEFMLDKELCELKEVALAEKLCGLLNNNIEGSLYFGINSDSVIEGIWFDRGGKDTFRNGIDRVMNRCLIPEVRANSYDIIFTPVTKSGDKLTETSKHSLFIVEIRVWPLMHMVYMVYQNRKCYTRRGTQTIECTVAQKKKEMMDEEEHDLKEAILALEAAANQDLPTLAKILKDMSPIQFDGIVKMKLKS